MTAGAVSVSLISVIGVLLLIASRGLSYFWPADIHQFDIVTQSGANKTIIGEIYEKEQVPTQQLVESGILFKEAQGETVERFLIKTGNREYVDLDFQWLLTTYIKQESTPTGLAVFERSKNGNFYGYLDSIVQDGKVITDNKNELLIELIDRAVELNDKALDLQNAEIGAINYEFERLRLKQRKHELDGDLTDQIKLDITAQRDALQAEYLTYEKQLFGYRNLAKRDSVIVKDMRGELVTIQLNYILDVIFPNDMSTIEKLGQFGKQIGKFIIDDPREANTEGGVFPAIFGTVFMVMLMAVIVTPFGVIAAVYLHEYAGKGAITKIIRISVINLAGVPSIVYGVFGLGFFVYMFGGSIDQLFYPEALPGPTFGTPGMLWSALTLAILTLPVVIVSTEEGLSRIPGSLRQGSLALGATKAETLWRIVIPMASPAIMTGLILAVARAAGEVAPLMLVGVVKMAPTLPLDGNFPFVHLDRKFMHLGFHIYDVGFQSPNVEAARPLVYATSFLLVTVIVALNITAIGIRNHLREKYKALDH
jgi:phosphate transport system permease protein